MSLLELTKDYAQVAQGLTQSELKKQFTPNEMWVIERCQHLIKKV